ncbi:MAG: isoprenylcysteine carboxylmethyltransferase family protein [Christiangramia sp.]
MQLKAKDYILVGFQIILCVVYIYDFKLINLKMLPFIKLVGIILTVSGIIILLLGMLQLNKNLSPFPTPKANSEFVKTGLYKFVRHPIYTGILLNFLGYGIYSGSVFRILITLVLYILFIMKARYEEKLLMKRYNNYASYREKTGRFFPKIF